MELQEGHTVGIDLGTTFSCLAVLDEQGRPTPVANDDGDVETPSLVLLGDGGHVIVGPSRQRAAMEDPSNIIERIKRHMGSIEYKKTLDGHEITPEFLSALILKKLKQDAEERIGKVGNAVITVPYYFNDSRRKATQDAGKIAGLNVIDIINEPTAATLAYAWQRNELGAASKAFDRPKRALVFDLGGGTFDVTVVKYTPTHFQVLATDGDVQLGGVDWNDRLSEFICQKYQEKYNQDPRTNPVAMQVLRNDCDAAKIQLSSDAKVTLNFRHEGKSIAVPITRDEFEELTADLLQRTVDTTELVLEQAKMKVGDLDALVMVGGSTLMPAVTRRIQQMTGVQPYKDIDCHTAVARGAAIHAAILDIRYRGKNSKVAEQVRKHLESVKQEDVNSHALGIVAKHPKTQRPVNHVMIPRNSQLPIQVTQTFWTNHDNQERVNVQVVEGDAPDPAACSMIGNCRITKLPANLPKGSPVEVTYAFDISGRVKVRAFDKTGGQEAAIEIDRRGGLTDAQVDLYTKLASEYAVE